MIVRFGHSIEVGDFVCWVDPKVQTWMRLMWWKVLEIEPPSVGGITFKVVNRKGQRDIWYVPSFHQLLVWQTGDDRRDLQDVYAEKDAMEGRK